MMSVELLMVDVKCNLACSYCYQQPMRDGGNTGGKGYDMAAMKKSLSLELLNDDGTKRWKTARFAVFGGEPLLAPLPDICEMWAWGLEKFGVNGIQTNGSLITDAHVEAFKKYKVQPGLSIDGPGELNDVRWAGTLEATRKQTQRSNDALKRLLKEKLYPSLIVTLHQGNASAKRLPALIDWLTELWSLGLQHVNLHFLESETPEIRARWALSDDQNAEAVMRVASVGRLRVQPVQDMVRLLLGNDQPNEADGDEGTSCVWNACDPYTTNAVHGVLGDGTRANCGRTSKDGVNWVKADVVSHVRQLTLYETPMADGGCKDCRFFFACKGQCPGTAIDGDWRNRTEHCGTLLLLFARLEAQLAQLGLKPISLDAGRRQKVEAGLLAAYRAGHTSSIGSILRPARAQHTGHQDVPHGDSHGDHTDAS